MSRSTNAINGEPFECEHRGATRTFRVTDFYGDDRFIILEELTGGEWEGVDIHEAARIMLRRELRRPARDPAAPSVAPAPAVVDPDDDDPFADQEGDERMWGYDGDALR